MFLLTEVLVAQIGNGTVVFLIHNIIHNTWEICFTTPSFTSFYANLGLDES